MADKKDVEQNAEQTLITLDQLSQTLEVMTCVVDRPSPSRSGFSTGSSPPRHPARDDMMSKTENRTAFDFIIDSRNYRVYSHFLISMPLLMKARRFGRAHPRNFTEQPTDAAASCFLTTKLAHCEAKKGWWTLGSRPCVQLSLNSECDSFAARGTTLRFGHGSD